MIKFLPIQIGSDFYNREQVSLLGFGIYYSDQEEIKCIHVDLVQDTTIQDGYFTFYNFSSNSQKNQAKRHWF